MHIVIMGGGRMERSLASFLVADGLDVTLVIQFRHVTNSFSIFIPPEFTRNKFYQECIYHGNVKPEFINKSCTFMIFKNF